MKSTDFLQEQQKKSTRPIHPRIFVFCEGETEKTYFDSLRIKYRQEIILVVKDEKQNKLIEYVESWILTEKLDFEKDSNDCVWCVLDVEKDKDYWNTKVIPKIQSFQDNKNKFIVFSNPCFELWLLLYFKYTTKIYTPNELYDELTKILGGKYKKGESIKQYLHKLEDIQIAIDNSKKLIKEHKTQERDILDFNSNPVTTIHLLIESIIKKE